MTDKFFVEDIEKVCLRIKVLGYPHNGESIMISLTCEGKELYNVVTDCYEVCNVHSWSNLLSNDTRINAFIWTHPDEDHSLGVKCLLDRFDPEGNAKIFIPTSLTKDFLVRNKKETALTTYLYLKEKYNKGQRYQWNEVSLIQGEAPRFLISKKIIETTTNFSLDFKIGFMAPISAISNRRTDVSNMSSGQMNDMSLFFIAQIKGANYIFGGDLAKQTIQFLDEDYLNNCRFVKIPHHGSKDPIKLVDKIQPIPSLKCHSVTTVFGETNPFDIVLDRYSEKSEYVYSTGRGEELFGIVEIDYNVTNYDSYTIKLKGNAHQVRPSS